MKQSITQSKSVNRARDAAVEALVRATSHGVPRPMSLDTHGLDGRDARLAEAIFRMTLQRWITVNFLIDRFLTNARIEAPLRAILAAASAQLVFMDRLPAHAVVDVAVEQAKRRIRPGAGGLVNAVLRKVAEIVAQRLPDEPWTLANNHIPGNLGTIRLSRQALLKPRRLERYLSVATSHPEGLVRHWLQRFGQEQATAILAHSLTHPPTFVHDGGPVRMWTEDHEALSTYLAAGPDRWVQDPTSALAVGATTELAPKLIVDLCAGKGTKTRQLLATHREAKIIAADTDPQRFEVLRKSLAGESRVKVMPPNLATQFAGQVELLLLDVPCSNTGVLARRPEAKYRYSEKSLASVIDLQRQIIEQGAPLLCGGGHLLYATCSIEPRENEQQTRWMAERFGWSRVNQHFTLPGGDGETYHDGGYWAVLKKS